MVFHAYYERKVSKNRLILGDGDFSYTKALIEKHTNHNLSENITATELKMRSDIENSFHESSDCLRYLENCGVSLEFGVNATKIHEIYHGIRFERIQFNHPRQFMYGCETKR